MKGTGYVSDPKSIGRYFDSHRKLLASSKDEVEKVLNSLLSKRLTNVIDSIPFYSERCGHKREDITLEDFPILEKDYIRSSHDSLMKDVSRKEILMERKSSGSSGIPITVWKSDDLFDFYSAISLNQMLEYGWTPLDVTYVLHGAGIGNVEPGIRMQELERRLKEANPNIVSCYPSYLLELISADKDEKLKEIPLKFIMTHSEQSSQSERDRIKAYFGAHVFDEYGATEVGPIAFQCKNGNYHILEDNVHLEIVDSKGNPLKSGETGEILVTDLRNEDMPLIRYRIGDYASLGTRGDCECSWKNFRTLKSLEGRVDDSFILPSGIIIPTGQMISAVSIDDKNSIREWQVIQETPYNVGIYIVPGENYNPKSIELLKKSLNDVFDGSLELDVKLTSNINTEGKKRQLYKSLISRKR